MTVFDVVIVIWSVSAVLVGLLASTAPEEEFEPTHALEGTRGLEYTNHTEWESM